MNVRVSLKLLNPLRFDLNKVSIAKILIALSSFITSNLKNKTMGTMNKIKAKPTIPNLICATRVAITPKAIVAMNGSNGTPPIIASRSSAE